jgi:hypothetical protein
MAARPAILERLKGVQRAGRGWLAFCPAHNDQNKRSLSVGVGDDGRTLLKCHAAGCSAEEITAAVDMTLADLAPAPTRNIRVPLTLAAFADAKGLPIDFLAAMGIREDGRGLIIEYRLADGSLAPRQRRRAALVAKAGSTWDGPTGTPPVAYGLWRLDDARERGELLLVEGESDTLTAWFHNIPALGIPGADMTKVLTADAITGIERLWIIQEPDRGGPTFVSGLATRLRDFDWRGEARVVTLPVKDLNDLHRQAGTAFADRLAEAKLRAKPLDHSSEAVANAVDREGAGGELVREGLDLALVWPDERVRFTLTAVHDGRSGVAGELTVIHAGRRLHWGALSLAATSARETLRKKLEHADSRIPWGDYLEEVAYRLTQAAREGEPIVALTGRPASPTRALVPRLLYEGEPTLIFGDGDTGKSLTALTIAGSVHAGVTLPGGFRPERAMPAAYLDWETSRDTVETRLGMIARGLGIDPPPILYKRMTRPLVDVAATLAAEFARHRIGLVVIDSKMFAVGSGDGVAFHEPITSFYNALALFSPAAVLVLNHVTNADAKNGTPARPFGGAFAFNGPRLIWEAKRDRDVTDATAIAFTCIKANNLPRVPDPFGLRFQPGDGTITVYPFDLTDATPSVVAGASLTFRVSLALARGLGDPGAIAKHLGKDPETIKRLLRRLRAAGKAKDTPDGGWELIA